MQNPGAGAYRRRSAGLSMKQLCREFPFMDAAQLHVPISACGGDSSVPLCRTPRFWLHPLISVRRVLASSLLLLAAPLHTPVPMRGARQPTAIEDSLGRLTGLSTVQFVVDAYLSRQKKSNPVPPPSVVNFGIPVATIRFLRGCGLCFCICCTCTCFHPEHIC